MAGMDKNMLDLIYSSLKTRTGGSTDVSCDISALFPKLNLWGVSFDEDAPPATLIHPSDINSTQIFEILRSYPEAEAIQKINEFLLSLIPDIKIAKGTDVNTPFSSSFKDSVLCNIGNSF